MTIKSSDGVSTIHLLHEQGVVILSDDGVVVMYGILVNNGCTLTTYIGSAQRM